MNPSCFSHRSRDGALGWALLLSLLLHTLAAVAVVRAPVARGQGVPVAVISVELREPPPGPPSHLPSVPISPPDAPRAAIPGRDAGGAPLRGRTSERLASPRTPVVAAVAIERGGVPEAPLPPQPLPSGLGGDSPPVASASPGPALSPAGISAQQKTGSPAPVHPSPAYYSRIRGLLERTREYPHLARRARMEGNVTVRFLIRGDGSPGELRVIRSSGHGVLDEAALRTVRSAAPFPLPPEGTGATDLLIIVPILFRMER